MRILSIQPYLRGYSMNPLAGGKNKAALRLGQYLAANGHDVTIMPLNEELTAEASFPLADGKEPARVLPDTCKLSTSEAVLAAVNPPQFLRRPAGITARIRSRARARALHRAMETANPDVVHVNYTNSDFPLMYRNLAFTRPMILTHTHDIGANLDCYDSVVFFSEHARDKVIAQVPGIDVKSTVIYPPVDEDYYSAANPGTATAVVFVGVLQKERKGLDILMNAYSESAILNRFPLTVVGDGQLRKQFESMAAERRLNVKFTGRVPTAEIVSLLRNAGLYVMPSREESFGIAYSEAMCMGVPVIGFAPTILELNRKLGIEVGIPFNAESESHSDLARVIVETMESKRGFDATHRRALLEKARSFFSPDKFGSEYIACYKRAIEQRSRETTLK